MAKSSESHFGGTKTVGKILKCCEATVRTQARAGELPVHLIADNRRVFHLPTIRAIAERRRQADTAAREGVSGVPPRARHAKSAAGKRSTRVRHRRADMADADGSAA